MRKHHPTATITTESVENEIELETNDTTSTTTADALLEQAIQSLGVPSDIMLSSGILPEESLELLEDENFSTVNLNDLQ